MFIAGNLLTGTNMYAYCDNNPVIYVDPTGMISESMWDTLRRVFGRDPNHVEKAFIDKHPFLSIAILGFANYAESIMNIFYSGNDRLDEHVGNAFLHMYWSSLLSFWLGWDIAWEYTLAHEGYTPKQADNWDIENLPSYIHSNTAMDIFNNAIGVLIGYELRRKLKFPGTGQAPMFAGLDKNLIHNTLLSSVFSMIKAGICKINKK